MNHRMNVTSKERWELNQYHGAILQTGVETEETVQHMETIETAYWLNGRCVAETAEALVEMREALDAAAFYVRESDANGCTVAEMLEYVAADA